MFITFEVPAIKDKLALLKGPRMTNNPKEPPYSNDHPSEVFKQSPVFPIDKWPRSEFFSVRLGVDSYFLNWISRFWGHNMIDFYNNLILLPKTGQFEFL